MWTLSGFADEIAPDLDEQLALVTELGLKYIELRTAWNVNALDLDDAQLRRAKQALDAAGVKVSSIGSPIGKIKITDDNGPHLERMAHAVKVAQFFEAPYMRIFSYFIDESENPDDYRDEVITRMRDLTSVAEGSGITLIHENEKRSTATFRGAASISSKPSTARR